MSPAPSVGRVAHYVARGSADGVFPPACRAATITEAGYDEDQTVGLAVLNPTGMFFHPRQPNGVEYGPGEKHEHGDITGLCDGLVHRGGTWHWPARVNDQPSGAVAAEDALARARRDEDTARSAARGQRSMDRR